MRCAASHARSCSPVLRVISSTFTIAFSGSLGGIRRTASFPSPSQLISWSIDCLAHADEPWAKGALEKGTPHALAYIPPN